ncbi:MAG: hypothetical protein PVI00_04615 [Desulfobacterales bacterium]
MARGLGPHPDRLSLVGELNIAGSEVSVRGGTLLRPSPLNIPRRKRASSTDLAPAGSAPA